MLSSEHLRDLAGCFLSPTSEGGKGTTAMSKPNNKHTLCILLYNVNTSIYSHSGMLNAVLPFTFM